MAESPSKKKTNASSDEQDSVVKSESISIADIEKLFSLMRENEIAELEIEQHKSKIHIVSKSAPVAQQPIFMQSVPQMPMLPVTGQSSAPAAPAPDQASAPAAPAEAAADAGPKLPPNAKTVLSPMVGTFYRAASPEAPPFIREGDVVNEDTVMCIIEAMKLMNEIKAEQKGKVLQILVENGMPVEFNQPLFILEP